MQIDDTTCLLISHFWTTDIFDFAYCSPHRGLHTKIYVILIVGFNFSGIVFMKLGFIAFQKINVLPIVYYLVGAKFGLRIQIKLSSELKPRFRRRILALLGQDSELYWVSKKIRSYLHSQIFLFHLNSHAYEFHSRMPVNKKAAIFKQKCTSVIFVGFSTWYYIIIYVLISILLHSVVCTLKQSVVWNV